MIRIHSDSFIAFVLIASCVLHVQNVYGACSNVSSVATSGCQFSQFARWQNSSSSSSQASLGYSLPYTQPQVSLRSAVAYSMSTSFTTASSNFAFYLHPLDYRMQFVLLSKCRQQQHSVGILIGGIARAQPISRRVEFWPFPRKHNIKKLQCCYCNEVTLFVKLLFNFFGCLKLLLQFCCGSKLRLLILCKALLRHNPFRLLLTNVWLH